MMTPVMPPAFEMLVLPVNSDAARSRKVSQSMKNSAPKGAGRFKEAMLRKEIRRLPFRTKRRLGADSPKEKRDHHPHNEVDAKRVSEHGLAALERRVRGRDARGGDEDGGVG